MIKDFNVKKIIVKTIFLEINKRDLSGSEKSLKVKGLILLLIETGVGMSV